LSAMNRFQFRGITLGALALTAALAHPFPSPQAGLAGANRSAPKAAIKTKANQPNKSELVSRSRSGMFVENAGQWDHKAVSHARSGGLDYWVTKTGVVMDFSSIAKSGKSKVRKGHVVEMKFDGAHAPLVSYTGKAKVKTDYLIGKVTKPTHASSYAEVHLSEIYPGVEMRNYFDHMRPRYDLIVKPGADASKIKLAFNGQTKLSVDKSGSLVMGTQLGDMSEAGLKAFTVSNGKTTPVKAAFKILPGNKVAFDLGAYDHKAKLVVDPLIYGSYFGGDGGRDAVLSVTSTPDGGVYMTGWTESVQFPVIQGAYQINLTGQRDAFITLFRGDAYDVLYNSFIGGTTPFLGSAASTEGHFIQISPDGGTLWLVGSTTSGQFPLIDPGSSYMVSPLNTTLVSSYALSFTIDPNAFLVPTYATYIGADAGATQYNLAGFVISPVDGSLLFAGTVNGTINSANSGSFPVGPGTIDVFLLHLDVSGTVSLGSRYFGGNQDDSCTGLATDPDGDFVISGTVPSPLGVTGNNQLDLSQDTNYFDTNNVGWPNSRLLRGYDLYAAKISSTDPNMGDIWSGVVGGSSDDASAGFNDANFSSVNYDFTNTLSNSVATDSVGNVYILGTSASFNYPRTANVIGEQNRQGTVVVTEIASDGSAYVYSTGLNTSGIVVPVGIAVDGAGNASITGLVKTAFGFNYTGTPPNPIIPNIDAGQGSVMTTGDAIRSKYTWVNNSDISIIPTDDAWLNVINSTATQLMYGTYIGGDGNDDIAYPFVDQFGDIWVFGEHECYYGYIVPPSPTSGTPPQPKFVSYVTPLPSGFLSPLAFKLNPDGPYSAPVAPSDPPEVFLMNYPYDGNPATVPMYETTDGYVLRFRVNLPVISSVTLLPTTIPGGLGAATVGTVTLSGPAPTQGADVTVTINSNRAAAQFSSGNAPYSFTVPIAPNATSGTFNITTNPVLLTTPVTIEANYAGNIKFNTLTVVPWLQQFSVTPTTQAGGNNVTATVTLSAKAPSAGVPVSINADVPGDITGTLPIVFTVASGSSVGNQTITTAIVPSQSTVNFTATVLGVSQKAAVTLTPLTIGISSITFDKTTLNAGDIANGTVTLATPAPDAGLNVTLNVNDPSIAFFGSVANSGNPFPSTIVVAIAPNSQTGTFTLNAGTLADTSIATITGSTGSGSTSTNETVNQVVFTVKLNPSSLPGGKTSTGTITLPAPTTMNPLTFTVTPSDQNTVPAIANVVFPANGTSTETFLAPTNKILNSEVVTLDVDLGSVNVEDVPVQLSVNAARIVRFSFNQSSIRSLKSDIGYVTLDGTVPQDVQIDITYGPQGLTDPGTWFSHSTVSVLVKSGTQVSQAVTVTAKRFTRNVSVPIQATIHGTNNSLATSIQITR